MNTKPTDLNDVYSAVQGILQKVAWWAAHHYGLQFEDAMSECDLAFVHAARTFEDGHGMKFSTYVHSRAQWHIRKVMAARRKKALKLEPLSEMTESAEPSTVPHFLIGDAKEILGLIQDRELIGDAKEILDLILDTPADFLGHAPIPIRQFLGRVKTYLVKQGKDRHILDRATLRLQHIFRCEWAS